MAVTSRRRMYTWSRHVMSHVDYYIGYLCRMFPLLLLVQLSHISHTQGKSLVYYIIQLHSQKSKNVNHADHVNHVNNIDMERDMA